MLTAFIYPGQGSQYSGMGKDAAGAHSSCAAVFDRASKALGFDVAKMVFNGDEGLLTITENTQPALLTTCAALTAPLLEAGIRADVSAGLSIGEYAAHVLAGTFSFEDAVRTVRLRGKYMQEEVPPGEGGMAAVLGLDAKTVEACCAEAVNSMKNAIVEPANYNCPGQIVIAGHTKAVETACALCLGRGAKRAIPLAVSAPFHCSLMLGAAEKLETALRSIETQKMSIPVVGNAAAEFITDAGEAVRHLVRQVAGPVLWEQSVRAMIGRGVKRFVEIGPGKTLAGFIKKIDKDVEVLNVGDAATIARAIEILQVGE